MSESDVADVVFGAVGAELAELAVDGGHEEGWLWVAEEVSGVGGRSAAGQGAADELVVDHAEEAGEEEASGAPEADPATTDSILVGANVVAAGADRVAGPRVAIPVEVPYELTRAAGDHGEVEESDGESRVASGEFFFAGRAADNPELVLEFGAPLHVFPGMVPVAASADRVGEREGGEATTDVRLSLVEGLAVRRDRYDA